jgi:hypothetical protein
MRQRRSPRSHHQFVGCNRTDKHVKQPAALGIIERDRPKLFKHLITQRPLLAIGLVGNIVQRETHSRHVATSGAEGGVQDHCRPSTARSEIDNLFARASKLEIISPWY